MVDALHALAARAGVELRYEGFRGEPVEAGVEALLAVLAALGHPVRGVGDAPAALAAADRAAWSALAPPVVVSWDGEDTTLALRVRADLDARWELELAYDDGERRVTRGTLFSAHASEHTHRDGAPWCVRRVRLEGRGALGYHRVTWRLYGAAAPGGEAAGHVRWIAAPRRAHPLTGRTWGVFAPLYALRTPRSGAAGDLRELRELAEHVATRGGAYVATLPLLAGFLDEPCQPSPYAPASRRFWNELYLELDEPGAPPCAGPVDYPAQYRWKRGAIDRRAAAAWQGPDAADLLAFARAGEVADYAAFRALGEVERRGWQAWPQALRDAPPYAADAVLAGAAPGCSPEMRARWQSHVWAQRELERQLGAFKGAPGRAALYLDLPVGVNPDAWDVWRHRDVFVMGAGAGAPPDALFLGGQDWGLPPLHPERVRASGYEHVIACVRHHVRHAGILRIDHVMGLHRLYWVPAGMRATEGVYVRYRAEELYAVLALESARHGCALVGEDLGTVPPEVGPAMRRHALRGLYVGQFAAPAAPGDRLGTPTAEQVASLNTHDTPTFCGWWRATDVDAMRELGLLDDAQAADARAARATTRAALLAAEGVSGTPAPDDLEACRGALLATTRAIAASPAPVVLVTVEDAWLEPEPQNVPGTSTERPNWQRAFALTADALRDDPRTEALLAAARR